MVKEKFREEVECIWEFADYNSGVPDGTGGGLEELEKVGRSFRTKWDDSLGDNGQLRDP